MALVSYLVNNQLKAKAPCYALGRLFMLWVLCAGHNRHGELDKV